MITGDYAATAKAMFHFKKIDSSVNDLVIAPVGGDLVDGAASCSSLSSCVLCFEQE